MHGKSLVIHKFFMCFGWARFLFLRAAIYFTEFANEADEAVLTWMPMARSLLYTFMWVSVLTNRLCKCRARVSPCTWWISPFVKGKPSQFNLTLMDINHFWSKQILYSVKQSLIPSISSRTAIHTPYSRIWMPGIHKTKCLEKGKNLMHTLLHMVSTLHVSCRSHFLAILREFLDEPYWYNPPSPEF